MKNITELDKRFNHTIALVELIGDKLNFFVKGEIVYTMALSDYFETEEEQNAFRKSVEKYGNKRAYFVMDEHGDWFVNIINYLDYHLHSDYSLLDGANKTDAIAKNCNGASGLTDHGNVFGLIAFHNSMDAALKKPVYGYEGYMESLNGTKDANHIILLIKNEIGWKNICLIVSEAEENFYRKPQIKWSSLRTHSEGLVCTSACLAGEVSQRIKDGKLDEARAVIKELKDIFGDDFYLEIQRHGIDEENVVNPQMIEFSKEFGIKIVAANDSHYTKKEDKEAHDILLCIGTKTTIDNPKRFALEGTDYHILSNDEMEAKWEDIPEAVSNTLEILDKCEYRFDLGHLDMPKYPVDEGYTSEEEEFEALAKKGFSERFPNATDEYKERLEYEIGQIKQTGFTGYFLMVSDFIRWARSQGIEVGPGRGSAVGSLVCYCLGITNLDPIPNGLFFERFINPERVTPPDIDTDFQDNRRAEVVEYVKSKYGTEKVSNIITFGTLAPRVLIRDICRTLNVSLQTADILAKSVPAKPGMTIAKALDESEEFRALVEKNEQNKHIIKIARTLEGLHRHTSIHACGILISNKPIRQTAPEVLIAIDKQHPELGKQRVVCYTGPEAESLGLVKMDFLGLRNLRVLQDTVIDD